MKHSWTKSFPAAITVCDTNGIILEMNDKAVEMFKDDGGLKLIGSNLLECHPEPARTRLAEMLKTQKQNSYTIEKNGSKKFIYQSPCYDNGRYAGFVELCLPIPWETPHFIRE
jgi:transcriptional regulator with PAS, ATPase and Fis domain